MNPQLKAVLHEAIETALREISKHQDCFGYPHPSLALHMTNAAETVWLSSLQSSEYTMDEIQGT